MSNPVIADNKPKKVSLKKGEEYAFCVCGRSNNQPFCDGSHSRQETGITPVMFKCKKTGTIALCGCRGSGNKPYCDGSHSKQT